jgi:hypothetical protein
MLLAACLSLACALPATASAQSSGGSTSAPPSTGGTAYLPPAGKAKILNGIAIPPADAPPQVVAAIYAANQIVRKPYVFGGGHNATFSGRGYDCSGSVSYALHGGGLLTAPLDSSSFMSWGLPGKGRWITVYTNPGHAFVMIAGLRFDTGFRDRTALHGAAPGSGPRWGHARPTKGFKARHPVGF